MHMPRIFVSYHATDQGSQAAQLARRLIRDLQAAGGDVATDGESVTDATFVQTINRELPICQWFVFVETPGALQSPRIQMTVNTALNLVAQRRMQEAVCVLTSADKEIELPAAWARLHIIKAGQNYTSALNQLLTLLQLKNKIMPEITSLPRPVVLPTTAYDRPAAPPRPPFFRSWAGRLLVVCAALILVALLISLFVRTVLLVPHPQIVASNPTVGSAHFTSSGLLDTANSRGLEDGIQVDLSQLAAPGVGKSYYGWLLPDRDQPDGSAILLGRLPVQNGKLHFGYSDPAHTNLLGRASRFLITEGNTDFAPGAVPQRDAWRYYGEVPQVQNPTTATLHLSLLDLLRRLLVSDPQLQKLSLHGGLNIWLSQNTRKVLEWATAARGTGQPQGPELMHRHFIRILDYVDSIPFVQDDVPAGTPIVSDPQVAQVALLTTHPGQQNPPGYTDYATTYLQNIVNAPGITKEQHDRVGRILAALDAVKVDLEQVHMDARRLVQMGDAQLLDPATVPLLDDLVVHANAIYVGQADAATGIRQGGTTWIYDSIQALATIPVNKFLA